MPVGKLLGELTGIITRLSFISWNILSERSLHPLFPLSGQFFTFKLFYHQESLNSFNCMQPRVLFK